MNKLVKGNLVRGLPSILLEMIKPVLLVIRENSTEPLVRLGLVVVMYLKDDDEKPCINNNDSIKESECKDQEKEDNVKSTNNVNTAGNVNTVNSTVNVAGTNKVNAVCGIISIVLPFDPKMHALEDDNIFDFSRFEDPNFPDRVYKVEKALYGLHQAPRAWYETLSTYLFDNGFQRGKIDQTLFIKWHKGDILMVQDYVDDIIFGSTKKELCIAYERLMHEKFQMSSMRELTFFLGLQDEDDEEVDVYMYWSMIGSLMYLTSSRPDIMFAVCACARYQVNPKVSHLHDVKKIFRLISWQCKKQTVVNTSSTEAEYVAAASCCAHSNDVTMLQALVDKKKVVITEATIRDALRLDDAEGSNDVTMLQALVDKKKVVITEATIRDALRLDDAEGVYCLPNEEIFTELACMGYEKPSIKLTFYKAFFSSQVGKGFSAVETPLFEGMLVAGELEEQGEAEEQVQDDVDHAAQGADTEALDACAALARRVEHLEYDKVAQALEITKLKRRVAGVDQVIRRQAEIYQIDMDHASKVLSMQEDEPEVQEVVDFITTAKLITEAVIAASKSVTAASTTIAAVEPQVPAATLTAVPVRVVVAFTKKRKRVVIRDLEEESTTIIPVDTMSKDKGK
nr:hypothetical protein [Tanacetum cinerariifolium]